VEGLAFEDPRRSDVHLSGRFWLPNTIDINFGYARVGILAPTGSVVVEYPRRTWCFEMTL